MCEDLKIVKIIFYSIAGLIMAGCAGVLVLAFQPSLTEQIADKLNGSGTKMEGGVYTDVQPGININWVNGSGRVNYVIPDSRPGRAPASVSGRTDCDPIKEEAQQVPPEEEDSAAGTAPVGNTGAGLTFDEEFYPYYAMLNSDMQQLYCQIYANGQSLVQTFGPVVPVNIAQIKNVYEAVYNDHPEMFWLEGGYSCKYLPDGSCVEITLKYNQTASNLEAAKQDFQLYALRILSGAGAMGTNTEKEQYAHDGLMLAADYDVNAPMNQSAYSALVQGKSVCAGYARAYQYLLQQLGIPCYYCTGYAGEDHAWNIVKLDGNYYNVDVTWDDTEPSTYDYYNKSDRAFAATHMRTGLSVYLPACVTGFGQDTEEDAGITSDIAEFINPNPSEPLRWEGNPNSNIDMGLTAEEKKQQNLEIAGITEDEVRETMDEYYKDCLRLLKEVGKGDKQYDNVIPESLWNTVEQAYLNGDYKKKYVDEALKELEAEHFVIRIQIKRLGGGYYRIYHNVYTY